MNNRQISAEYEGLKKRIEAEIQVTPSSDMVLVYRFLEKAEALINLHYCVTNYRILLESTEDEESRSLVKKHFRIFMNTVYIDYLNDVIEASNDWEAYSFGMVSLQREIQDVLVPIRDLLQAEFDD